MFASTPPLVTDGGAWLTFLLSLLAIGSMIYGGVRTVKKAIRAHNKNEQAAFVETVRKVVNESVAPLDTRLKALEDWQKATNGRVR